MKRDKSTNTSVNETRRERRAVIYLRARSDTPPQEEAALRRQRAGCRGLAEEHGLTVEGEYVDRGRSANDLARPGLQALLARLGRKPGVQVVVVTTCDRLTRSREASSHIGQALAQAKACIRTAWQDVPF